MNVPGDTNGQSGSTTKSETHVIVLPGGGYAAHEAHEAEPIAEWLEGLGVRASVFRYPLHARHPAPLEALRSEIRRRREGGADRIGVIGFSAGGHLAGLAALAPSTDGSESVDFVVLGYAITSMETETYRPARMILLGENATPQLRRQTSLDALVTPSAPPFFIWHTAEDIYVPPEHTYRLARALAANEVAHAVHVFAHGPHSLGLARGAGDVEIWTTLAASWLAERTVEASPTPSASELNQPRPPASRTDLEIRPIEPGDKTALTAALEQSSKEAVYRRFLNPHGRLTAAELRYLTEVDHRDHEALLAIDPASNRSVGVARYVRDPERGDTAEIAVSVLEPWQGRGVGKALLHRLADRARDEGITRFTALMLSDNQPMRRLLAVLGTPRLLSSEAGAVEVAVDLGRGRRASPRHRPIGSSHHRTKD